MDRQRLKYFLTSFLTFLVSMVLLALVLEAALRIFYGQAIKNELLPQNSDKTKLNFRQSVPRKPKGPGEMRIVVLGDSYTWGDGVEDPSQIWPNVLEKELNKYSAKKIRVINLGICGLTTVNELELLVKVGYKFDPDFVIVGFLINDILPSGAKMSRVGEDYLEMNKRRNIFRGLKMHEFFNKASCLYFFMNKRYQALQRKLYPARKWNELYEDNAPEWKVYKKAIAGFGSWSHNNATKVVFVLFPSFGDKKVTPDTYKYKNVYDKVSAQVRDWGMMALSLLPNYTEKNKDFRSWMVSPYNAHPNAQAHALAGEAIARYVRENKLIPERPL